MWQDVMQITCNFRGSSIDTRQSVYVSRFESICIPNYRLLVVNEGNEADGIKGSLKRRCRNCWGVFKSPGGLQPIFPPLSPSLASLSLWRSFSIVAKVERLYCTLKLTLATLTGSFSIPELGRRIEFAVRQAKIPFSLISRMMIATANFNR